MNQNKRRIILPNPRIKLNRLVATDLLREFLKNVNNYPQKHAILDALTTLSYRELDIYSSQMANHLISIGIKSGDIVAVYAHRCTLLVVVLLSIIKSGATFCILDPDYPAARLLKCISLISPKCFIQINSSKKLPDELSNLINKLPKKIILNNSNDTFGLFANYSIVTPRKNLNLNSFAYITFTSGTTGAPKGILGTHLPLSHFLDWHTSKFKLSSKDKFSMLSSLSNDPLLRDIFAAFWVGGTVYVPNPFITKDPDKLGIWMCENRITIAHLTPAMGKVLVNSFNIKKLADLRYVFFCGDKLFVEDVTKLEKLAPKVRLINCYGASETPQIVAYFPITKVNKLKCNLLKPTNVIPVGKGIRNAQLLILGKDNNLVDIEEEGEIYVRTPFLSQGYLNDEKLTKDKFIVNPFTEDVNDILYRTGDLGKYLSDGSVECMGRADHQVKIRGFRVELGEIETILAAHEAVFTSIVLAKEDGFGDKKLVAYIVPRKGDDSSASLPCNFKKTTISVVLPSDRAISILTGDYTNNLAEGLREHLTKVLPHYMVPSFFVFVDRIPLTPSGKVDLKVLYNIEINFCSPCKSYSLPKNVLEQELCTIWMDALKLEQVSINDNFFKIGGDSIIAIQLVSRARQKGIYFTIRDLFNFPTIAMLSLVAKMQKSTLSLEVDHNVDHNIPAGSIALTPIQHIFFENDILDSKHFSSCILLSSSSHLVLSLLEQVFSSLIVKHDVFKLKYNKNIALGKVLWEQKYTENVNTSICSHIDLSSTSKEKLFLSIRAYMEEIQTSLNIETGPLLKAVLFTCSGCDTLLLIVTHQLVMDYTSWQILLEDFEMAYKQLLNDKIITFPNKTSSYQQWSDMLQTYASSAELLQHIEYWKDVEQSICSFPPDFNCDTLDIDRFNTVSFSLSAKDTFALINLVPKAYHTQISDILLTALTLSVGDLIGNYKLALSFINHKRAAVENLNFSHTVGCFTTVFPVVLTVSPLDLEKAIKTVKEEMHKVTKRGVEYGILAYLSSDASDSLKRVKPSFSFNYIGQWDFVISQENVFYISKKFTGETALLQENPFPHLININCSVWDNVLFFSWKYSANHYKAKTLEELSKRFLQRLKEIIHYCSKNGIFGYTPSDFNLVSLSQNTLDKIFGSIPFVEDIYPLSSMQEGFLFNTLYNLGSNAYYVQSIFELEGELNIHFFKSAWQLAVAHNPNLRSGFIWTNTDIPVQYVLSSISISFETYDWISCTQNDSKEKDYHKEIRSKKNVLSQRLRDFIQKDKEKGFDLSQLPLFRLYLIRLEQKRYVFIWSRHHIILDGWSGPIVLGDVLKVYQGLVKKQKVSLPFRRPYKDYIAWLQKQKNENAMIFWREYLANLEGPTKLSFKGLIKEDQQTDYGVLTFSIAEEESKYIQQFAQENNLTLNAVILGALGIVLKKYILQQNIVIGMAMSGRSIDFAGIDQMVGVFINTLPIKIHPQENNIVTYLKMLQDDIQQLNNFVSTPLTQIQSWVGVKETLSDILYVFENYPVVENYNDFLSDFSVNNVTVIENTEYPLTIAVLSKNGLHFDFNYQICHFDSEIIQRLFDHLEIVLKIMCKNSCQPIKEICFLTEQEKQQILVDWNNLTTICSDDYCVYQLFEEQVNKTPNNVAVIYKDTQLTYQELNAKANQLARYIRDEYKKITYKELSGDALIGICVEKSIEMIIGILGILKAGGAYVPLDPKYPEERLKFMLEDTQIKMVLTQKKILKQLPFLVEKIDQSKTVILLDSDEELRKISQLVITNLSRVNKSTHLAYVMYTSGSTGIPKGVMIEHGGLCDLIVHVKKFLVVDYTDKILQFSSVSFDASVMELILSLFNGAQLYIPYQNEVLVGEVLAKILEEQKITIIVFPSSVLETLPVNHGYTLKTIMLGGDAPKEHIVNIWKNKVQLINTYGATELSVCVSMCQYIKDLSAKTAGKAFKHIAIYIY